MTPWTEENTEQLRALWADGLSCSQISRALGCGITRNSVISKAHRLNLEGRSTKPSTTRKVQERRTPSKPRLVIVKSDEPAPPFLCAPGVFAETGTCRFIHGDTIGSAWCMCGHPVVKPGYSWCAHHFCIVFDTARTAKANEAVAARKMGLG